MSDITVLPSSDSQIPQNRKSMLGRYTSPPLCIGRHQAFILKNLTPSNNIYNTTNIKNEKHIYYTSPPLCICRHQQSAPNDKKALILKNLPIDYTTNTATLDYLDALIKNIAMLQDLFNSYYKTYTIQYHKDDTATLALSNFKYPREIGKIQKEPLLIDNLLPQLSSYFAPRKYSIAGLQNLGNTCYLNTAIKCMVSNLSYSLNFQKNIKTGMNQNLKNYSSEYAKLIDGILTQYKFSPSEFKCELGKLDSTFSGYDQGDCFQALITMLDNAHKSSKLNPSGVLKPFITEYNIGNLEIDKVYEYISKCMTQLSAHESLVYDMFLNMCVNFYRCPLCNNQMIKFDIMTGLPLEIANHQNLEQCLKQFFAMEKFSDYKCKSCGKTVDIEITHTPIFFAPIVIIQLKRFKIDYSTMQYTKDYTKIKYPKGMEELDLHMHVPQNMREHLYIGKRKECIAKYYLTAVGIHSGSLHGGHYYSYILNMLKNNWECHNDSSVSTIDAASAYSDNAITLIYTRADVFQSKDSVDKYKFEAMFKDILQ